MRRTCIYADAMARIAWSCCPAYGGILAVLDDLIAPCRHIARSGIRVSVQLAGVIETFPRTWAEKTELTTMLFPRFRVKRDERLLVSARLKIGCPGNALYSETCVHA